MGQVEQGLSTSSKLAWLVVQRLFTFVMVDVFCKIKGMEMEDVGVVADEVKLVARCEEFGIGRDGDTNSGDEVFALVASVPATSCSEFHSTRIESMMTSRSEFETELEYHTAYSKMHWSELRPKGASGGEDQSGVDHRHHFEKLQKDVYWGPFCNRVQDVVLGRKLAEGAQANIYEAQVLFKLLEDDSLRRHDSETWGEYVVKLMKGDSTLKDLQCQWPHGIVEFVSELPGLAMFGALIKEPASKRNKFGFVIRRCWGDLRSLIDLRMVHKSGKDPPFSLCMAKSSMNQIVLDMVELHRRGIIHRDLKASNVLVSHYNSDHDIMSSNCRSLFFSWAADFECSVGVVETSYWRAPEILQQLKNRIPCSKLVFDKKADVYSFAMTCYEIVIGFTPFEGLLHGNTLCDAILNGYRPELPHDLDLEVRAMITSCWDPNPLLRPSFDELRDLDGKFWEDLYI